jgi:hypothetical protein
VDRARARQRPLQAVAAGFSQTGVRNPRPRFRGTALAFAGLFSQDICGRLECGQDEPPAYPAVGDDDNLAGSFSNAATGRSDMSQLVA